MRPNQVLCANNAAITLAGAVTIASGGTWSGGLGTYNPNANTLNATYTPTTAEINSGSLTLTLSTTGNGTCNAVPDQVEFTFTAAPTVEAGAPISVCSNNAQVSLGGTVTIASGGTWSGGLGSFVPNANNLNALYNPTPAEIAAGSLVLTLTSTGNGTCTAVDDFVNITFTLSPTANAGTDQTVCANSALVNLNGSVNLASGGIWSGGSGTFSPNNTSLGATYTPSPAEITAGTLNLTLTTTGNANCNAVTDQMTITITPAPVVNAGTGSEFCSNNPLLTLSGSVTGATGGTWSGGSGTFAPNANDLNATYAPSQSEINSGSLTLTLTSTGNGTCTPVSNTVTYTFGPSPTADAGVDRSLCSNNAEANLVGAVTIATGGTWSGGAGNFSPSVNSLNVFYTPTPAELTAGTVTLKLTTTGNGNCNAVVDSVKITYTAAPTASAGNDRTVCGNNPEVTLNGAVTVATGGVWSGGTGSFDLNNTTLNATYTPSADEITNGSATLTLTTTGNNNCNPVSDQMVITITPEPTVDAGAGSELCANNAVIALNGSVNTALGGTWSGGNGTFAPNANDLNASYTPSQGEINAGTLTLTLTSTGNATCVAVSDMVTYTFSPAPVANAGADQTLCANNAEAVLTASVTIATGGVWSGGLGNFSPSANSLNAFYTPTPTEIANGTVTLTLTTTGNDDCNAVTDQVVITFTPAPSANAGTDKTVCANNAEVNLSGSVSIATGGTWSGGTGTFTPDANALNPTYTPSAQDITNGGVTLTLTTTGNGLCNAVTDAMVITITPAPTIDAGTGDEFCANNGLISLNGSVTTATGATWGGGSGTFSPNANTLNATYQPSAGEINSGSITLTLTSTGNGTCTAVDDMVTYTFAPSPTAEAGPNQTLCANNAAVSLAGAVTIATGGTWSGGAGTFAPNANALNATYTPTTAELTAGTLILRLTTTGNGDCIAVKDSLTLTFSPAPTANAGTDKTVCANNVEVNLNGSVSIATGGVWSGGSGTFDPANNTLNPIYTPSAPEIANGSVTLTLTTTGNGTCNAVSDQVLVTINPEPIVDAGTDLVICSNNAVFDLSGSVLNAGGGQWSGGLGIYDANNTDLSATYTPTIPEIVSGQITFTLTSTANAGCVAVTDQMLVTFTPSPTVNAGTDITLCATAPTASLNGNFTVSGGAQWSGGAGSFSPNVLSPTASYTPTAAEVASGSVTLTLTTISNGNCNAVSDQVTIFFDVQPTVNAGANLTTCANNAVVNLNGSFANASGVEWSGGLGFFNPDDENPSSTYTPSNAEIINGGVTLTLTTTGSGACASVSDNVNININPTPIVSAGPDVTLCANNNTINLSGSVQFAGGGQWSGGSGAFTPNVNALTASYQPSAGDVSAGFVTLTLTSTGNATCNPVTDQITITFTPAPIADAGLDITACKNNATVQLDGAFTVAEGANWTGGSGSFNPGASTGNAMYSPSQNELNNGSVTLTYTTFGNGNCLPSTDQVTLTFTPAPEVEAGDDYFACVDELAVPLSGTVTGPTTTGIWSTSGTGVFIPNAGALNGTYQVSSQDSLVGQVVLTLTSTSNGLCTPVTDQLTVFISPAGTANAGVDQMVCSNNPNASLVGLIGGAATNGSWSTSGSGIFTPNANVTNVTYIPSEADLAAGSIIATFAVNSCNQAVDDVLITYTPSPEVAAGNDLTACSSETEVDLNGFVGGASNTGTWTTSGSGNFVPSPNALNATYEFSAADLADQVITLTLTATNIGNCVGVSDALTLNIFPQGTANAGADVIACENNPEIQLNGSLTGADQALWSTTGTGTFAPNAQSLTTTYVPSEGDLVNGAVQIILTAVNSCNNAQDFVAVTFTDGPEVDAGPDQAACGDVIPFQISGSVSNAGGSIWTTTGNGSFQNANNLNTFYVASQDDIDNGGTFLILSSTGNGNCFPVADSLFIDINTGVTVIAGPDRQACEQAGSIQLFGEVSNGSSTGIWSTSGNGVFTPSATALNAVYQFTATEIAAGVVTISLTSTDNGICNSVTDEFELTFGDAAFVFAGNDKNVCETQELIQLQGEVSGETTTGMWSTEGDGVFFPSPNTLNPQYEPGAGDIAAGSVELTLMSTNNTLCTEGQATMTINFQPLPVANAGADRVVCGEIEPIQLLGSVSGATGGTWVTSGTGTFAPNANTLTALYTPSSVDSLNGVITLTLNTTGNAQCAADNDAMTISFSGAVTANAGSNQTVCEDVESVSVSGTVEGTSAYQWGTAGSGTFNPSNANLATSYVPSQTDRDAGTVTIYLQAAGSANCPGETDSLRIVFDPVPTIVAATQIDACSVDDQISVTSTVGNASAILWTSQGNGAFSPNDFSDDILYTPTNAEREAGQAVLTIIATSNGTCGDLSRQVIINLRPLAVVNAGNDIFGCETEGDVSLFGAVEGDGYEGQWSTNAFGSFTPSNTVLNGNYVFGTTDIIVGSARLILTSTNNGACPAVTDTVVVTINRQSTANAGEDIFVCSNAGTVPLNGTVTNAEAVEWTTSGDGVFLPSAQEVDAEYVIGPNDEIAGSVELTISASSLGGCEMATDVVTVNFNNPLVVDFTSSPGCVGAAVQFTDQTQALAGEITGWKWNFGNGNISNERNPLFIYNTAGTPSVQLVVQSSIGCSDTITKLINVVQGPTADFNVNVNPAPVNFDLRFTDASALAQAWNWDFGNNMDFSENQNVTMTYTQPGDYNVTLLVTGETGCTDSTSTLMTINGQVTLPPRLPNSFSPNGDDNNDVFFVRGGPFTVLDFKVYDGWGSQIFSTNNQDTGWDGTENGKQSPVGVYVYTIKATNIDGAAFDYSGRINLFR